MSDKFCCVTWDELYPELAQVKSDEIDLLVKEKGIPRSVFAGVIKLVNGLKNYCPYCGTCLNEELQPAKQVQVQQHKKALQEVADVLVDKPATMEKRRCNACGGKGILGRDKNGVDIRCMKCHGEGMFMAKHVAEDTRAKLAQTKVDNIREANGIGDSMVFAPEGE